ncbi:roadblock/LC7 domain-containing protein [Marilutibacter spongiae]|nr:roadblock/LC7 domain-containing protein [Lysobacter spongiae]
MLERRLQATQGVMHTVMATADGRAIAHAARANVELVPARIAAIASSLLALGESFSRETLHSPAGYTSIASEQGSIVIVRVPSSKGAYTLCLSADRSETFAMALRFALDAASELASVLDRA